MQFIAEDPLLYGRRLLEAYDERKYTEALLRYNLLAENALALTFQLSEISQLCNLQHNSHFHYILALYKLSPFLQPPYILIYPSSLPTSLPSSYLFHPIYLPHLPHSPHLPYFLTHLTSITSLTISPSSFL